jgi:hypothetical protein
LLILILFCAGTFGILKVRFNVLKFPLPYMAKTWNAYRSKIDNIVWTCCILHNLLLRHDGLEFLWTKDDYLSPWYLNPDAEHRRDYDGPPIEERALNRRLFPRRRLGREGSALIAANPDDGVPPIEEDPLQSGAGYSITIPDYTKTEVDTDHIPLREALVKNFEVLWLAKQVQWLKYPKRK